MHAFFCYWIVLENMAIMIYDFAEHHLGHLRQIMAGQETT